MSQEMDETIFSFMSLERPRLRSTPTDMQAEEVENKDIFSPLPVDSLRLQRGHESGLSLPILDKAHRMLSSPLLPSLPDNQKFPTSQLEELPQLPGPDTPDTVPLRRVLRRAQSGELHTHAQPGLRSRSRRMRRKTVRASATKDSGPTVSLVQHPQCPRANSSPHLSYAKPKAETKDLARTQSMQDLNLIPSPSSSRSLHSLHRHSLSAFSTTTTASESEDEIGKIGFGSFVHRTFLAKATGREAPTSEKRKAYRRQIDNFLVLPFFLERFLFLGVCLCGDAFLSLLTTVPVRCVWALGKGFAYLLRFLLADQPLSLLRCVGCCKRTAPRTQETERFSHEERCDLMRVALVLLGWSMLSLFDISQVYHYVRAQTVLKLYFIFNMLTIVDKMCCSFGVDILDALWEALDARPNVHTRLPAPLLLLNYTLLAGVYVFAHSMSLLLQVITLNVCINSNTTSLVTLMISNNFLEVKSTVFKRFSKVNLFQIAASDVVERFQLLLFFVVIAVQNMSHLGLRNSLGWLREESGVAVMLFLCECVIDWLKHGFISKFNFIDPTVYNKYSFFICADFTAQHTRQHALKHTQTIIRRLGLSALPMAALLLRVLFTAFSTSKCAGSLKMALFVELVFLAFLLKLLLQTALLGFSAKRVMKREQKEADKRTKLQYPHTPVKQEASREAKQEKARCPVCKRAAESKETDEEAIAKTSRFTLFGSRVPFM